MSTQQLLNRLRASGTAHGPLFEALERLAAGEVPGDEGILPLPTPAPLSRTTFHAPPTPQVQVNPVQSLTACLDAAECPTTARRIFRLLFELALDSARARGLPVRPDVAVFHLPLQLLAAHLQLDRVTVWRNVRPLVGAGVLAERDHYGTLRGSTAVTGKLWAVSLCPERVLSGHAPPVRITKDDLAFPWRDLDKDARQGRTVYDLTRTEEQKARARAKKCGSAGSQRVTQQSVKGLKTVEKAELRNWALAAFISPLSDVTLTVARDLNSGLDAAFTLPLLTGLSRTQRSGRVEQTARILASAFGDTQNLRFWCWLIWQTLRAADQGQDWSEDVAHLIARVLHDVRHEARLGVVVYAPAALVVNGLRNCGLLDALRGVAPTRVGRRPGGRAA